MGRDIKSVMEREDKNMTEIYSMPISAKGIVFEEKSVWLRKNERNEWELPGGKVDLGEQPTQTVTREMREELGFDTEIVKVVYAWVYQIKQSSDESGGVLVLCYLLKLLAKTGDFETEGEAGTAEFKKFSIDTIDRLNMPQFYKKAIQIAWKELLR